MNRSGGARRAITAALAALLVTTISAGPSVAVSPLTMNVLIGYDCVGGSKPISSSVTVTLKRGDGTVLETKPDIGILTQLEVCFSHKVRVGYKLQAHWDTHRRQITIPDLTIGADRVTDVVSGHAPARANVLIQYAPCQLSGCGGYQLSRKASEITVLDILELTEGSLLPIDCAARYPHRVPAGSCRQRHAQSVTGGAARR